MVERLFIFAKAQVSSFVGGMVDYFVMIFITEVFHLHYVYSIAISGVIGAIINFSLNKRWTFTSRERPYHYTGFHQILRFSLVVLNSIILKASGTHFFTSVLHIDYKISRIITDLIVSWGINFILQKHWVFKKKPHLEH